MKLALSQTLTALTLVLCMHSANADQASDREEINALMWKYARALDSLDADAYASVYTEDGQFGSGTTAAKGHDALRAMIEGVKKSRADREAAGTPPGPMYHMTTDSWIEFIDADHARHHSYWLTAFGPAGPGGTPNIAAVGRGVDELVRVDGKWLIKVRDVAPQE